MSEKDRAREQAKAQLDSIREMVAALDSSGGSYDEAIEAIQEDPLEVAVRSGWHSPRAENESEEYKILLCTGGPACRIVGDLGTFNEPNTAHLEYQDWFTPWEPYLLDADEEADLLKYAACFWFGE